MAERVQFGEDVADQTRAALRVLRVEHRRGRIPGGGAHVPIDERSIRVAGRDGRVCAVHLAEDIRRTLIVCVGERDVVSEQNVIRQLIVIVYAQRESIEVRVR